ncbi:MAG TPA: helix-turn-helix transcriptional regulator [Burkholderiales bacterium]|nr:helix-turn-helix transcriptional regulator [Burkholderiales bacterium]
MYVSQARQRGLLRVIENMVHGYGHAEIRTRIGEDLLRLLRADYYASYVWDPARKVFADGVSINMNPDNLARYDAYYQFHDPMTYKLQRRRNPTRVTEIIPQHALVKTEFFNDFLYRDGLYYGVNLYAYDGALNIGDVRIWRGRRRDNFDDEDMALLRLVKPFLRLAMKSLRAAPAYACALPAARALCLTPREGEIARLLCAGKRDEEIARALGIAFSTVRTHLRSLFEKSGTSGRTALVARLLRPPQD